MNNQRRRFRPRQQKNNFRRRNNNNSSVNNNYFQGSGGSNHFHRNGSAKNPYNLEKAIQKYTQLAKDALSSGDPILSENYYQHADHYSRRLSEINDKAKEVVSVKEDIKEVKTNETQN
jgi:hypothetical protein|tara:strand:- start:226 stop:579 length:354 start_codon:yes stop_codon:yes gene_type:complete